MPQLLLLLTYDVTQRKSGSTASVVLKNVNAPISSTETVKSGSISKTEYIKLAGILKTNINSRGRVPSYLTTSRGKIRFETMMYLYSKTMDYHAKNKKLPGAVSIIPWNKKNVGTSTTVKPTTQATSGTSFTISQIATAATNYRNYVDKNGKTPSTVTVNNKKLTTPQFLQLLSYAIAQLNSGCMASITLKNVTSPANPTETVKEGTLTRAQYVTLAQNVKSCINSFGKAPGNVTSSLGKIRYETLVYIFSKTMSFYGTNHRLPNTLSVTPYSYINFVVLGDAAAIIDKIGMDEAKYKNIQGNRYSYLDVFLAEGGGNCWGSSLYLYTRLTSAHIQARIMGYLDGISNNGFKHAWVQINTVSGWKNWDYNKYSSKHYGDLGGGTIVTLIGPGKKIDTQDLITAYYAVL